MQNEQNEPNKSLEQRVAALEQHSVSFLSLLTTTTNALQSIQQVSVGTISLAAALSNQIREIQKVFLLIVPADDKTKSDLLGEIRRMESQMDQIEATLAALKNPPQNRTPAN
jgi:hypothetical protein